MEKGTNLKNIANSSINTHDFFKKELNLVKSTLGVEQYPISVDIGYSSVKVCSKYGKHSFPSFVIPLDSNDIIASHKSDILYRENNKTWVVGKMALDTIEKNDIIHYEKFYSREKIKTFEYTILARTALFFALMNKDGELESIRDNIFVKTGLPEVYVDEDSQEVKTSFIGNHNFEIKFGDNVWQRVNIDIAEENVGVLSQPLGTIWNCAADVIGNIENADIISEKRSIVLDIGFYSVDTFLNQKGSKSNRSTSFQLGMFEVLKRTCHDVFNKTGVKIKVYELQKYILSDDYPFSIFYGKDNQIYSFKEDLSRNLKDVGEQIVTEMKLIYDNFRNIDILILSGGSSIAMKGFFSIPHNVKVISPQDCVFANAQGFFSCLVAQLRQG